MRLTRDSQIALFMSGACCLTLRFLKTLRSHATVICMLLLPNFELLEMLSQATVFANESVHVHILKIFCGAKIDVAWSGAMIGVLCAKQIYASVPLSLSF